MNDLISRQAAIDAINKAFERVFAWDGTSPLGDKVLENVPSAQPDKRLEKIADLVEGTINHFDRDDAMDLLYQIKEVLDGSDDLPSAQPEPHWIPWDSDRLPEESGTYTVTAYDGVTERVTYAKYQKRLKRWELTGARAYWRVLAWMPLPEPYREERTEE